MPDEPIDQIPEEPEALVSLAGTPDEPPAPAGGDQAPEAPPAAWEAELDAFWQNVFTNVSPRVETTIHNYLLTETEALRTRLKALL